VSKQESRVGPAERALTQRGYCRGVAVRFAYRLRQAVFRARTPQIEKVLDRMVNAKCGCACWLSGVLETLVFAAS
jgi:hypothetical protein